MIQDIQKTYRRKPTSAKLFWQAAAFGLVCIWMLQVGWKNAHATDTFSQIRGDKELFIFGLMLFFCVIVPFRVIMGMIRDVPILTLCEKSITFKGFFCTYTAEWTSLDAFDVVGKTFLSAKIIGRGVSANIRNRKEFVIPLQLNVETPSLCNELNQRIARVRGIDIAAPTQKILDQVKTQALENLQRTRRMDILLRRLVIKLSAFIGGGIITFVALKLLVVYDPQLLRLYAQYIPFMLAGLPVGILLIAAYICNRKYPLPPQGVQKNSL